LKFTVVAKVTLTFKTSAMKSYLPFLSIALVFASCTSAYKSTQTPDDVYYSPERPREEYVRTETKKEKYSYDENYDEDRYLRMKTRNYRRWSAFDDDWYSYSPYYNRYNLYNPWNSYTYWNHYYNPYCKNVVVVNPRTVTYNKPRQYNLHVFDDPQVSTPKNPKSSSSRTFSNSGSTSNDNYRGSGSNAGNFLRGAFGNSGNSSGSSSSSSSSSSGSSSSSSSGSKSSSGSSSSGSSSSGSTRRF